jgi:hypothetical protein
MPDQGAYAGCFGQSGEVTTRQDATGDAFGESPLSGPTTLGNLEGTLLPVESGYNTSMSVSSPLTKVRAGDSVI